MKFVINWIRFIGVLCLGTAKSAQQFIPEWDLLKKANAKGELVEVATV